jgi:hypothetical protein
MQGRTKQTIHLHIQQQGKLHKSTQRPPLGKLLPSPEHSLSLQITDPRLPPSQQHKRHTFFLKQQDTRHKHNKTIDMATPEQIETGAFRAIHTASPLDTLKGFPLRSGTSLRPFRRGIRTSLHSRVLDIDSLIPERPVTRVSRARVSLDPPESKPLENPPRQEYTPKYSEQFE